MKFLATIALLASAVAAAPAEKLFNLKTSGAANSTHNDLYLSVGRGIINDPLNNEALFAGAPAKRAATFYVNNGTIRWDSGDASTPWALDLIKVNGVRKERAQVSVDPTTGSKGFTIGPKGLQGPASSWGGWLCMCYPRFLPGAPSTPPQANFYPNLHYLNKNVPLPAVPTGCDKINLEVVPKSSA
ncbi:hypothetical protein N7485_002736 [Penicillium canescens]|nr:hypothetical protein N7485_002736 [Penicillium canescens]